MNEDQTLLRRKLFSIISLSMRAGEVVTGEDGCVKAVQSGKAHLVLVATDASDNTRKKFSDKTSFYGISCYCCFSKAEIESAIGKPNRATIAISCEKFAARIVDLLSDLDIETYRFKEMNQIGKVGE